jgi:transcriptional regulator with XRE-family HTH domain
VQQDNTSKGVFSGRLKLLMENHRISQVALAEKTGIKQQHISRYLHGREPRGANLLRLCEYFGISADVLLGRVEQPQPVVARLDPCVRERRSAWNDAITALRADLADARTAIDKIEKRINRMDEGNP